MAGRVISDIPARGKTIAGYWPLGTEIDCRPVLESFKTLGTVVVLPVVSGQGEVLIFRSWSPGDTLEQGPFGTWHPNMRADIVAPDIILTPLMAFDTNGIRLGYGAGYYDRTLAALRRDRPILTIGLAYDEQQIDALPADTHDQKMDAVVTDRRTLWFNESSKP